jgi:hypothetical protein
MRSALSNGEIRRVTVVDVVNAAALLIDMTAFSVSPLPPSPPPHETTRQERIRVSMMRMITEVLFFI